VGTLQNLMGDIRSRLDEPSGRMWKDHELIRWVNEGLRDVARRAEVLQASTTIAVSAEDASYTAPTDAIRIYRVEWKATGDTAIYPLEYRDFNSMDSVWYSGQAIAQGYPAFFTMWGFPPSLTIQLFPVPSEAGTLNVHYYRLPAALVAEGGSANTTIDLPAGWDDLIVSYVEFCALRKDADPRGQEAKQLYEQTLEDMISRTRRWTDQSDSIQHGGTWLPGWLYGDGGGWW
jgi:hypothetical protein